MHRSFILTFTYLLKPKLWKAIKSSDVPPPAIPEFLITSWGEVGVIQSMGDTLNKHFINAEVATRLTLPANPRGKALFGLLNPSLNSLSSCPFEVQKASLELNWPRSPGPDQVEPYFLKTAVNLIAGPISSIFPLVYIVVLYLSHGNLELSAHFFKKWWPFSLSQFLDYFWLNCLNPSKMSNLNISYTQNSILNPTHVSNKATVQLQW